MLGGVDGPILPGSAVPAFAFPEQAAAVLGRAYAYGRWLASDRRSSWVRCRARSIRMPRASVIDHVVEDGRIRTTTRGAPPAPGRLRHEFAAAVEASPSTVVDAATRSATRSRSRRSARRPGRSARSGVALDIDSPGGRRRGRGRRSSRHSARRRPADRPGDGLAGRRSAHPLRTRRAARRDRQRRAGRRPGRGDRRADEPPGAGLASGGPHDARRDADAGGARRGRHRSVGGRRRHRAGRATRVGPPPRPSNST